MNPDFAELFRALLPGARYLSLHFGVSIDEAVSILAGEMERQLIAILSYHLTFPEWTGSQYCRRPRGLAQIIGDGDGLRLRRAAALC